MQGVWIGAEDGTDINYVDRSHNKLKGGGHILCRADDFGMIRFMKYPSLVKDCGYTKGLGHSSHVTNCKFSTNDTWIFSAGGDDNCIFQWKVDGDFGLPPEVEEPKPVEKGD